jgi:hypothetical protein
MPVCSPSGRVLLKNRAGSWTGAVLPAVRLLLAAIAAAQVCTVDATAGEICRFAGTTDYDGHVAVMSDVSATNDVTRVDVVVRFEATTMFWFHIHYLVEEISTWRAGKIESLAVNTR